MFPHSIPLYRSEPHPCPYLEARQTEDEIIYASRPGGAVYQVLMDFRFRRSGPMVYRPICSDCHECIPIRVPVDHFSPSRSQRRVMRRNKDIHVKVDVPECTEEKWRIYSDYLERQHDGSMDAGFSAFEEYLYCSPTDTMEMTYRLGERVVAVGILDVCPNSLSTVYFYFDPAEAQRSLGTYGALCEIEECRHRKLAYWYVGFYIRGCGRMSYKVNFRPYELLGRDGVWRPGRDADNTR